MFKFVAIGILLIGILTFVMWHFWKMILLKHKYYAESQTFLSFIEEFRDVPAKLRHIKNNTITLWITAVIVSLLVVSIVPTYFVIARNHFASHHTHSYTEHVTKKPTCVAEGVLQQKCRYCDDAYEEPLSTVEHTYSKTNQQDATCTQEGSITYTCDMCEDTKTEPISLKEHEYVETVEKPATCSAEGVLVKQCQHCDAVIKDTLPANGTHRFAAVSFKSSTFWNNGYTRYSCEDCEHTAYSLRVQSLNWMILLAIVVLLVAIIIMWAVRVDEGFWEYTFERPSFWVALVCAVLSCVVLVCHFGIVLPHQKACQPIFPSLSGAPADCDLAQTERVESNYTENGTVLYVCQTCKEEYTEHLPLKEIDVDNISVYTEPTVTEKDESENNNKFSRATKIPVHTNVTGHLSSSGDVDFYKVTLKNTGHLRFRFTHEGDTYSNHWQATIYDVDKSTVLNEGYINTEEFGCADLPKGTYYLKISVISGGNPLLNTFSDADYHLSFTPECAEHTKTKQYFSALPTCSESVEIKTVCTQCGFVVSTENQKAWEHDWSDWEIIKPSSAWSLGKTLRTCTLCDETQRGKDWTYWWVIPLILAELILLIVCIVALCKQSEKNVLYLSLLSALSVAVSFAMVKQPIFDVPLWNEITLGAVLAIHSTLMVIFAFRLYDDVSSHYQSIYKTAPILLAVLLAGMWILGYTAFVGYAMAVMIVMAAIALGAVVWSIVAHKDYEPFWTIVNIVVAVCSVASAVFFWFKM